MSSCQYYEIQCDDGLGHFTTTYICFCVPEDASGWDTLGAQANAYAASICPVNIDLVGNVTCAEIELDGAECPPCADIRPAWFCVQCGGGECTFVCGTIDQIAAYLLLLKDDGGCESPTSRLATPGEIASNGLGDCPPAPPAAGSGRVMLCANGRVQLTSDGKVAICCSPTITSESSGSGEYFDCEFFCGSSPAPAALTVSIPSNFNPIGIPFPSSITLDHCVITGGSSNADTGCAWGWVAVADDGTIFGLAIVTNGVVIGATVLWLPPGTGLTPASGSWCDIANVGPTVSGVGIDPPSVGASGCIESLDGIEIPFLLQGGINTGVLTISS